MKQYLVFKGSITYPEGGGARDFYGSYETIQEARYEAQDIIRWSWSQVATRDMVVIVSFTKWRGKLKEHVGQW